MSRSIFGAALLTLFLVSTCSGAPVRQKSQCSSKCDESRSLLSYSKGKRYIYDFNNLMIAHIPKGTKEQVQLKISARAEFHVVDKCEVTLVVKNAKMTEIVMKDGAEVSKKSMTDLPKAMEKYPVPFGFNDGRITDICNNPAEQRIPLNVKKAMISQFQISMEEITTPTSLTERDVSGDCLTEYQFDKEEGDIVHITKMKNILGCANRKQSYSDLQGQDFAKATETSQMPLLKGEQKCSLQVKKGGHLVASTCKELQQFKPFSGKKSGSTFDVTQTMKLVKIASKAEKFPVFDSSENLLMTHNPTGYRSFQVSKKDAAEDILNSMCQRIKSMTVESTKTIVDEFPRLVRSMRFLKVADLKKVMTSVGKQVCKGMDGTGMRMFLDALAMVRTPESAIVMLDGLQSGKHKGYSKSWLFSLATTRDPSQEMIEKLAEGRLKSPLTISSIVNTYCKKNDACEQEKAVKKIVKQMTDQLQKDCSAKNEQILMALRAIGNLGAASDWKVINDCLNNKAITMGHRVSAAQAIRHLKCDRTGWKTVKLMDTFKNEDEDAELRINAYQSLMACPHRPGVLTEIINQLNNEQSQQVGSYVWSHLSNLLETSQVFRRSLKAKLAEMNFDPSRYARRFNLDPRRYSKNFEKSYYNEALNSGMSMESNFIYSDDSFAPRSVSLNLTGGLFGKSISLVEIGGRATNMDNFIQKGMKADFAPINNKGRMIHFDISKIKNPKRPSEQPSMEMYLRLFGNELIYKPNINPNILMAAASRMSMQAMMQMINKNPIDFAHTRMVMEAVISVPTITGLPIELSLDVAAALELKSAMEFMPQQRGFKITSKLTPVAGLGVVGRMRVDAMSTEIGVEFLGTAFTNTKMGGEMSITESEVTLKMDAPQQKQILIDARSRMVLVSDRKRREQPDMLTDTKIKKTFCFGKRVEEAVGMKICTRAQYAGKGGSASGPSFPFTGTNELVISAEPTSDVKSYIVRGKYARNPQAILLPDIRSMELELNAESSKDRQFLIAYNDNTQGNKIDISFKLKSPAKSLVVSATGDYAKREIDAKVLADKKELAKLTSRYKSGKREEQTVDIDIMGKKKYITATLSSNNLKPYEYDHSFKLETKAILKQFSVIAVRKGIDGGKIKYQFSHNVEIGKRKIDLSFNNEVKYEPNSQLMISKSNGDMLMSYKKNNKIRMQYKNNWKMESETKKKNEDNNIITEHSIKFDQTLLPAKFSKLNVKDGSLIVEHDLRFGLGDNSKRLFAFELKANDMKLDSSLEFSESRRPFEIELESALKTKTLDLKNNLEVVYSGWRYFQIDNKLENEGAKYEMRLENTINLKPDNFRVVQDIMFESDKLLYQLNSELKPKKQAIFQHKGLIAWSKQKSYSLESKIEFGSQSEECSSMYQINSVAFKDTKEVGKGYINSCPDLKNQAVSLEMEFSDAKKNLLFHMAQDGTFRIDPKDFHIGGSTALNVPGKVNLEFSINEILVKEEKLVEVNSNVELSLKEGKNKKTYGYRLYYKKPQGKSIKTKLTVMYHQNNIQLKSTYKSEFNWKKQGDRNVLTQKYNVKSVLLGNLEANLKTEWTKSGTQLTFKSNHRIKGRLELTKIYDIDGKQTIEGKHEIRKMATLKENIELSVTKKDSKRTFKHNNDIKLKYGAKLDDFKFESKFNSNYGLRKLTYKSKLKKEGDYLWSGSDNIMWTFRKKDGNLKAVYKTGLDNGVVLAKMTITSSFEKLKEVMAEAKFNLINYDLSLSGRANEKSISVKSKLRRSSSHAKSLFSSPDAMLVVDAGMKGFKDVSYKSCKLTFKTFYKRLRYIDFKVDLVNLKGDSTMSQLWAGYGGGPMGVKLQSNHAFYPNMKAFFILDPKDAKTGFPMAEVTLVVDKEANAQLKLTGRQSSLRAVGSGPVFELTIHAIFNGKTYIAKGSKMVAEIAGSRQFKGTIDLTMPESKLKEKATFDFNLFIKDFRMKYESDMTWDKTTSRLNMDLQSILELKKAKKMLIEIIPDKSQSGKKFMFLLEHDGEPVWNFNMKTIASLPIFKASPEVSVRLFKTSPGKKTTSSDLIPKATYAFDLKVKSSTNTIKDLKLQLAFGANKKGKARIAVDSSYGKKSVDASIDFSNFPSFSVDATMDGKTVNMKFSKSAKGGNFIATVGGTKIGTADIKYVKGSLIEVEVSVKPPKRKQMELTFKQSHPKGSWRWRDWQHESSFSLWTKNNKNVKFQQTLNFKFQNKELTVSAKVKSSIKAIESLEGELKVKAGRILSSFLDLSLESNGNKLTVKHKVPNWRKFYKDMSTKISWTFANRKTFEIKDIMNGNQLLFEITSSINVAKFSHFKLSHDLKTQKSEFILKGGMGNTMLSTNVIGYMIVFATAPRVMLKSATSPLKVNYYISGDIPKYGDFKVNFIPKAKDTYLLKLRSGMKFVNINTKVGVTSLKNPFQVNLKIKIATHLNDFADCNINIDQFVSSDFREMRHMSSVKVNMKTQYKGSVNYKVDDKNLAGSIGVDYENYKLSVKGAYDRKSKRYSHDVAYFMRRMTKPKFKNTVECEPLKAPPYKCVLTNIFRGEKQVFELIKTKTGTAKETLSLRLAWNDFKDKFVKFVNIVEKKGNKKQTNSFQAYTPTRNLELTYSEMSSGLINFVSFRTINNNGKPIGHMTMKIKSEKGRTATTTIQVTSTLFKKEMKIVAEVDGPVKVLKTEVTKVTANMYFGDDKSKLSFDFLMKKMKAKNELTLKLVGVDRYLNLFARYDMSKPSMTMSIGAEAEKWKRSLDILFEKGKRLETTVDNGKYKQTIKLSAAKMPQDNGNRIILEMDYPEVNGYLKVISQISRYPLSLYVTVHTDKKNLENMLVINGRFMNSRNILFEIKRFGKSGIVTDAYTQITLDGQNVITKLKWRPGLIKSIKKTLMARLRPTKLTQYLKNRGLGLKEVAQRISKQIVAPIKSNVDVGLTLDFAQAAINHYEAFKKTVKDVAKYINVLTGSKNKMASKVFKILDNIGGGLKKMKKMITKPPKLFSSFSKQKVDKLIQDQYKKLYERLQKFLSGYSQQVLVKALTKMKTRMMMMNKRFNKILDAATVKLKAIVAKRDAFLGSIQKAIRKRFGDIINTLTSRPESDTFMKFMKTTFASVKTVMAQMVPKDLLKQMFDMQAINDLQDTLQKIREMMSWSTQSSAKAKKLSDWRKALQLLSEGDLKKAYQVYFKPELTGIRKWDPQQGSINWQIHLPYAIKNLQSVPMAIYAYTQSRVRNVAKQLQAGTFQLGKLYMRVNDEILRYNMDELWRRQLPPYASHAYVAGSQHFVTFDGVNIEHGGDCTYLLAHDFVDNSFSVLAEYKKMDKMVKRKNLIVQTPDAALYISPEGNVKVKTSVGGSANQVFPPFNVKGLTVTRWRKRLTVTGPRGLTIICNLYYDYCRISMSKWTHARINGFLGSNDYERGNDVINYSMASDNPYVDHAEKWQLGSCTSGNFTVKAEKDARAYSFCSARFLGRRRSSFNRCFGRVPAAGYMDACLNMYKMKGQAGACTIMNMYASKCKALGVMNVRAPSSCTTCGRRNRNSWRRPPQTPHAKKRHFIFIMEEKPCITKFRNKLDTIIMFLSKKTSGDTFDLIGFGGRDHRKEISNRVLKGTSVRGSGGDVRRVLKQIQFNGSPSNRDDEIRALQAVSMSLRMEDDPQRGTIIIMVSCSRCRDSAKFRYANLEMQMKRRGIRFHYLTSHSFGTYQGKRILGIDDYKYIGERGQRMTVKPGSVAMPKDSCSALSRATSGSIWGMEAVMKEAVVGLSAIKTSLRVLPKSRRRCTCSGNNFVRCVKVY